MELNYIFPDGRKRFRGEEKIVATSSKDLLEIKEKQFLMNMFASLPIEKQKQLFNFSFVNPFDDTETKSVDQYEYREMLRQQNVMVFKSEIII